MAAQCQDEGAISFSEQQLQSHYDRFHDTSRAGYPLATDIDRSFQEPLELFNAVAGTQALQDLNDAAGPQQYKVGLDNEVVNLAVAGSNYVVQDIDDTTGLSQDALSVFTSPDTSTSGQTVAGNSDAAMILAAQDIDIDTQDKICIYCGAQFRRNPDLRRHLRSHDPTKRIYHSHHPGCNYKGSYRRDKLADHHEKRHPGPFGRGSG